jgi:uncharacterized protein
MLSREGGVQPVRVSSFILRLALGAVLALGLVHAPALAEQPPAPPSEPTAAHIAQARQLVVATGMSRSFEITVPQILQRVATSVSQTRPELTQDLNIVLAEIKPEFEKKNDEMIETAAKIFARLMTEQEIKTADAFFESDVGRKYVSVEPAFFNDIVNAMQDWQQKLSQDIVARVREEMKKKGHDL